MLQGISSIHAGGSISCAVVEGRVACWGRDRDGRLGGGPGIERLDRPAFVPGIDKVVHVEHGTDASFARRQDGSLWVWGPNGMGDFGDGSPDFFIAWSPKQLKEWGLLQLFRGGIPSCGLSSEHTLLCAGKPRFRSVSSIPEEEGSRVSALPQLGPLREVAAGAGFSCVLRPDASVWCWGMNDYGQLGNGERKDSEIPVPVRGLSDIQAIAAGSDTSCALTQKGKVLCWGKALGEKEQRFHLPLAWTEPVAIEGIDHALQIAVGDRVACALERAGSVHCFGESSYSGLLGDGSEDTSPRSARRVRCIEGARQISVGGSHACALLSDGTARCWGSGPYGALGNGTHEDSKLPVPVLSAEEIRPPADRCPQGTLLREGPGLDPKAEVWASWCETPEGKRQGRYISRWDSGRTMQAGMYEQGIQKGAWKQYYRHGDLLNDALYDQEGKPHGIWTAFSLRRIFAFATCFDHGKRIWQVGDEADLAGRTCP